MPVQSGMTRATPKADNDPTVFVNAESRAGFFIIEIASYSSYYTIALGRIDGSISRTQHKRSRRMTNPGLPQSRSVKNGAEHVESVRDGRAVYLNGKFVVDVSVHPAYRNAVASAGALYDYQSRPENVERMTFDLGGGRRVNRCWQLPRNYAELVERRKALVEWAEVSCGFLGRSPDHVASSMSGMMMGIEVFDNYDEKRGRGSVSDLRDQQCAGRPVQSIRRSRQERGRYGCAHRR